MLKCLPLIFFSLVLGIPINAICSKVDSIRIDAINHEFSLSDSFFEIDQLDSALWHLSKIKKESLPLRDKSFLSRAYSDIGYLFALRNEFYKSIDNYNLAIQAGQKNEKIDSAFLGDQYYYIAYNYNALSDFDKSIKALKKSISFSVDKELELDKASTLSGIASNYFRKSDYDNALDFHNQALNIYNSNSNSTAVQKGNVCDEIAIIYYFKQEYVKALEYSQLAMNYFKNDDSDVFLKIKVLNNHALILIKNQLPDVALEILNHAEEIHISSQVERLRELTQFNTAFLNFSLNKYGLSKEQFLNVIEKYKSKYKNGHINIAKAYYYLSELELQHGNIKFAQEYNSLSLQSNVPEISLQGKDHKVLDETYVRSKRELVRVLEQKVRIENILLNDSRFNLERRANQILNYLKYAVRAVEELRMSYRHEGSQFFLAKESKDLFDTAVKVCYNIYSKSKSEKWIDEMYYFIEKSQSPLLLKSITAHNSKTVSPIFTLEKEVNINLAFYQNLWQKAIVQKDSAKVALYADYYYNFKNQKEDIIDTLKYEFPNYHKSIYEHEVPSIYEIQEILSPKQLYFQFYYSDSDLFQLVLTKDKKRVIKIENSDRLNQEVSSLLKMVQRKPTSASDSNLLERFESVSYSLYEKLFLENIRNTFNGLIVVANGQISQLPFEALISKKLNPTQTHDFLNYNYLIKNCAISYQPSASVFYRLSKPINRTSDQSYGFAPFIQNGKTDVTSVLPDSENEIGAVKRFKPFKIFTNKQATKNAFLNAASKSKILHLATHGRPSFENHLFSSLIFYPEEDSIENKLYAYELQNLKIPSELVILSACETGIGKLDRAEGALSLARSFFNAGSQSVIMSRWKINDRSTSQITQDFYAALEQKISKDKAMQEAINNYLQKNADQVTAHPYYWAGLALQGSLYPIQVNGGYISYLKYILLGIIILFLIGKFIKK